MIVASEAKVDAKIVKDAFATGYMSGRVICTCVIQTETNARKRGSKQEEKERIREGNNV
jgi:hypothetical protein